MRGNNAKGADLVPLVLLPPFCTNERVGSAKRFEYRPQQTLFLLEKRGSAPSRQPCTASRVRTDEDATRLSRSEETIRKGVEESQEGRGRRRERLEVERPIASAPPSPARHKRAPHPARTHRGAEGIGPGGKSGRKTHYGIVRPSPSPAPSARRGVPILLRPSTRRDG